MSDIAWFYDNLDQYKEGLKYVKKAIKLGRNDAWINVEYGACLAGLGKYEEAIEKFEYALSLKDEEKDLAFIYNQLGWCYRLLGDNCKEKYEDALPFLLRAEELRRDDEWLNTEIGINLGRSGKINEGIERLKKSLTMVDKDNISQKIFINSELAWLYGRLEDPQPEEALKYLNTAKELGREDEWIHSQIGYQLGYNPEKSEEALEHFEKAIELGRDDAWIFEMKGIILLDLKRYEEALESFKKAYDKDNNGWYLYSMGRCLRGLERYEEAIEILLKSRQISLDEEDVVDGEDFELAHCYIGIGDKENAQKYLDSARDSITERGILNDYFKEKIDEIEKGISSLDILFN